LSINLTDDEVRAAAGLLSSERLSAFVAITGTERDAIALHHLTMRVGAALVPLTGMIEIVLRNAVCERLRQTFDKPDWLTHPPPPFAWKGDESSHLKKAEGWARRAAYTKLTQAEKRALDALAFPHGVPRNISHEKRSKARQSVVSITTGQLIAQLTLFFWKRLFSHDYEATLWQRSLRKLFPNKSLSRADVSARLETLYQTRNRIAHHEPVIGLRLQQAAEAVNYLVQNFQTTTPSEVGILAKMTTPYRVDLATEVAALAVLLSRFTVSP
jgi:hypothetical protein